MRDPAQRVRAARLELESVFRELSRAGELPVAAQLGLALLELAQVEKRLAAAGGANREEPIR